MRRSCYSGHRCNRRDCPTCRWRYSGRVARRILSSDPRCMHAVEIDANLHTLPDFWCWRVEVRNVIDHRRRACRWWRNLGLSVWLSNDGHVRGIVSLGAVTVEEFEAAVGRRWSVTLRDIDSTAVREEIYRAIRPGVIADFGLAQGRYQPIKLYVGPRRAAHGTSMLGRVPEADHWVEPMPMLF